MEGFFIVLILLALMVSLFFVVVKFGKSNFLRWFAFFVMSLSVPLTFFSTQFPRGTDLRIEHARILRPEILREVRVLNAHRVFDRIFLYVLPPGGVPILVSIPYSEETEQQYLSAKNRARGAEAAGREAEIIINFSEYGGTGRAPVSVREYSKNNHQR
jgi:energy-coupling factor transporter transmembrane protein EcfT